MIYLGFDNLIAKCILLRLPAGFRFLMGKSRLRLPDGFRLTHGLKIRVQSGFRSQFG